MPISDSQILDQKFFQFIILEKITVTASNFSIDQNTFNPLPYSLRVTAHLRTRKKDSK